MPEETKKSKNRKKRKLNEAERNYEMEDIKPCVMYVRVSTEDQKDGFSIPAQIELLMQYAQRNNLRVVRVFEGSMSAKDSGRIQFNKMYKYLNAHPEVNRVLVEKTDRLYRNFKDYALMDDNRFEIHLVKENEVLSKDSTSHQKLVHGLKVLLAKNFVDNLREETMKGRRRKAEEGFVVGRAPYGYKKVNKNEAELVPQEAEFVKKAYELYDEGYSLSQTRRWLLQKGWQYRPTQQFISRGHLHRILSNPMYKGVIVCDTGEEFPGKHTPIVSPELFERVQNRLVREKEYEHDFLFAGIIRCERCGCLITMELKKDRYIYYHCTGNHGKCKQTHINVPEHVLVSQFLKAMRRIRVTEAQRRLILKAAEDELYKVKFIEADSRERLVSEQQQLKKNLESMYEDKLSGVISQEFFIRKSAEMKERLEEIEHDLDSAGTESIGAGADVLPFIDMINNLSYYFQTGGYNVQRELAAMVFERVTLKGRTLKFTYSLPFRWFVHDFSKDVYIETKRDVEKSRIEEDVR